MVAVLVGYIEVWCVADAVHQVRRQPIVSRKDEPGSQEGRLKPWITDDRAELRLNQDPGVPEGGCPHCSLGNRGIGELLATAGDVLRPLLAIPVAQFEPTRGVRVPGGRSATRGCGGCRRGTRRSRHLSRRSTHRPAQECAIAAVESGDDVDDLPALRRLLGQLIGESLRARIEGVECHVFEHPLRLSLVTSDVSLVGFQWTNGKNGFRSLVENGVPSERALSTRHPMTRTTCSLYL